MRYQSAIRRNQLLINATTWTKLKNTLGEMSVIRDRIWYDSIYMNENPNMFGLCLLYVMFYELCLHNSTYLLNLIYCTLENIDKMYLKIKKKKKKAFH